MIVGGIADKLGNRYEAKWVVRSLLKVLSGEAQWLNFESVDTSYRGFEFAVSFCDTIEWHQTKENAPRGNWTINALKKEGVLDAFSARFQEDASSRCIFVSQDNAKDFRTLSDKSLLANSFEQYIEILSLEQKDIFEKLSCHWSQPPEKTFDWLNRTIVECLPGRELDSLLESFGGLYFQNGAKNSFPILRDILEKNFNKVLTSERILKEIAKNNHLKVKAWSLRSTIHQQLNSETKAYLDTYTPFGAGGSVILREQSTVVINKISSSEPPNLIVLKGVAGAGKSGVVREVIEGLKARKFPYFAFRVDHFLSCSTKEQLGAELIGHEESIVSTLKGTFPNQHSVLIIDQIDAVSEVSGRDGRVRDVIFRLIADAYNFGGMTVVIVCRTFDFSNDRRFKSLEKKDRSYQLEVPLLDWKKEVEPHLTKMGVSVNLIKTFQRKLLCLPVNLAIFMEINDPGFSFESLSSLHSKLIIEKERVISNKRKVPWHIMQPMNAICEWMTKRQQLTAPASVLDSFPGAVDILCSEGLILHSRGKINFFHESFFDHVYARNFINSDSGLIDLLEETEQHLFRRTQVRQILEALRQHEFSRYILDLKQVITNNRVRFHVKTAVCQWMSSIEKPTSEEFEIISEYEDVKHECHQFFSNAVLSTYTWFDLLNDNNWIERKLEETDNIYVENVLWWLSNIAAKHPAKVSSILESWIGRDPSRVKRIINWYGYIRINEESGPLLKLFEKFIKLHPESVFSEGLTKDIISTLSSWVELFPDICGKLLGSVFSAWFAYKPLSNPFDSESLKEMKIYHLNDFSKKNSKAFLEGTTGAILRAVNLVVTEGRNGANWYCFKQRTYSGHRFGFDEFLGIYRTALLKVAEAAPNDAAAYLKMLPPYKHDCFMHLHLETIRICPRYFSVYLPALVQEDSVFKAGWDKATWLSLANACNAAFPHISDAERADVEEIILNHRPEYDFAKKVLYQNKSDGEKEPFWTKKSVIRALNRSGFEQWCILETIGAEHLSFKANKKLFELRRKFPKLTVTKPRHKEAHFVDSPIKRDQCQRMKDKDWLSAIESYHSDEDRRYGRDFIDGGARQLARELQEATKGNPDRFSKLCLQIPYSANKAYIEHILWGLSETNDISVALVPDVIKYAHLHPDTPYGEWISRLIRNHCQLAEESWILEILIWYALNGRADEYSDTESVDHETITIENLIDRGMFLDVRGTNGDRGSAWEAIGEILWHVKGIEEEVWKAVEVALESEQLISVRCSMMRALSPLFNFDKKRFQKAVVMLIELPGNFPKLSEIQVLSPLITRTGIRLFPYIFYWLPELAATLVEKFEKSGDEIYELIGGWLMFCESFRNEDYIERAEHIVCKGVSYRQILADISAGFIEHSENRGRSEDLLVKFFSDVDKKVREKAAHVFSGVKGDQVEKYRGLAEKFIASPAFLDNGFTVLNMLEEATCDVLDLIVDVTEKMVAGEIKRRKKKDQHGGERDAYQLQKILKREYVSSEGNAEARKKILDMIDLMLFHGIYGGEDIASTHDRW